MRLKSFFVSLLQLSLIFSFLSQGQITKADSVIGEPVVTLGADLSAAQREQILNEMSASKETPILKVTNAEEHKYLGQTLSKAIIGSRAISSARIILRENGTGISVKTHNISSITEAMYASAATTAGIKDADIYVTAPVMVSGTAALTGVIKAFEKATGKVITEDQKQVANKEVVYTQKIAQQAGETKAIQFINKVKEGISKENPSTPEEYKQIINNIAQNLSINLDAQTIDSLVGFCTQFAKLDIDWSFISQQMSRFNDEINKEISSNQIQDALNAIGNWFKDTFQAIANWISK